MAVDKYTSYYKVVRVIESCDKMSQLISSKRMIKNYRKLYNCNKLSDSLKIILNKKIIKVFNK